FSGTNQYRACCDGLQTASQQLPQRLDASSAFRLPCSRVRQKTAAIPGRCVPESKTPAANPRSQSNRDIAAGNAVLRPSNRAIFRVAARALLTEPLAPPPKRRAPPFSSGKGGHARQSNLPNPANGKPRTPSLPQRPFERKPECASHCLASAQIQLYP